MFDYYSHVFGMKEEKLNEEIKRLNDQLFKLNPESPMYNQVLDMLDTANQAYTDLMYAQRFKDTKDDVLEIGNAIGEVKETDYDSDELLNAVVTSYTTDGIKKD